MPSAPMALSSALSRLVTNSESLDVWQSAEGLRPSRTEVAVADV